ncbi:MAG: hypothetical protein DDT29_01139 [Dehalococcoidia bacterium]|nr:hypothetical protein [Bacillota bacterium]
MAMPFSRQIEPSALYEAKGHWEALEARREQGTSPWSLWWTKRRR